MSKTGTKATSCDSDLQSVLRAVLNVIPYRGFTLTRKVVVGDSIVEVCVVVDQPEFVHFPFSPDKDVA